MARFIKVRGLERKPIRLGFSPTAKSISSTAETIVDTADPIQRRDLAHHSSIGKYVVVGTSATADGSPVVWTGGVASAGAALNYNLTAGELRVDTAGVFSFVPINAATNAAISANASGNPRIDLISVPNTGGASVVTAGTAAASPVAPATPAGNTPLYTVAVANGAAAPGTFTDVRPRP